jgi:nucleoside-diphosphate-sugar epimerase
MKVFVTGHRGYIGAHLVGLLQEAGHHVTGCVY